MSGRSVEPQILADLRLRFPAMKRLRIRATNILNTVEDAVDWQLEELYIVHTDNPVMPNIVTPQLKTLSFGGFQRAEHDTLMARLVLANSEHLEVLEFKDVALVWERLRLLAGQREFSLVGIRDTLTALPALASVDMGLAQWTPMHFVASDADALSRIFDARPRLGLRVEVSVMCMRVSGARSSSGNDAHWS